MDKRVWINVHQGFGMKVSMSGFLKTENSPSLMAKSRLGGQ
jgi:hypothetical protein